MARTRGKGVEDWEKTRDFREGLIQLYKRFKADVEALCKKHKVEINFWYSPSKIPQPKFIIDGIGFDADELYDEKISETLAIKQKRGREKDEESVQLKGPQRSGG
ncbi:MAG: hypothetical protein AOA65_1247 [Candidatus Bathyarchaeota archaeon BA1]|nr:MAG: hypothetical protein AOA65_1247 [Candidatus Bathyarchaeota archaeon BA1]